MDSRNVFVLVLAHLQGVVFTGPALKVLSMELVPLNKSKL